jgi:hypothetical protein
MREPAHFKSLYSHQDAASRYCSTREQRRDWKNGHQQECKALSTSAKTPSPEMRLAARILWGPANGTIQDSNASPVSSSTRCNRESSGLSTASVSGSAGLKTIPTVSSSSQSYSNSHDSMSSSGSHVCLGGGPHFRTDSGGAGSDFSDDAASQHSIWESSPVLEAMFDPWSMMPPAARQRCEELAVATRYALIPTARLGQQLRLCSVAGPMFYICWAISSDMAPDKQNQL